MAEKKITKKEMFERLLEVEEVKTNEDMVAFIRHEIELLVKKSAKSGSTKTQKENEEIKVKLVEELAKVGKAVTISEFQKASEYASQFSNQKISALFKLMDGVDVEKSVVKGKSYFKVVEQSSRMWGVENKTTPQEKSVDKFGRLWYNNIIKEERW